MERAKKPLPPTYFLIYLGAAIALHFLFPVARIVQAPYTFLGLLLIVSGVVLNVWADSLFKREKTTVKPFEKPSTLVTEGPFRFSRHPMYLGFVSILLGLAVFLGSLVPFLTPVAMILTLETMFIPYEESEMEATFGEAYRHYKKRVRRWL